MMEQILLGGRVKNGKSIQDAIEAVLKKVLKKKVESSEQVEQIKGFTLLHSMLTSKSKKS